MWIFWPTGTREGFVVIGVGGCQIFGGKVGLGMPVNSHYRYKFGSQCYAEIAFFGLFFFIDAQIKKV